VTFNAKHANLVLHNVLSAEVSLGKMNLIVVALQDILMEMMIVLVINKFKMNNYFFLKKKFLFKLFKFKLLECIHPC
jgi:hypothetical protein